MHGDRLSLWRDNDSLIHSVAAPQYRSTYTTAADAADHFIRTRHKHQKNPKRPELVLAMRVNFFTVLRYHANLDIFKC